MKDKKLVIIRKPHMCFACGRKFEKGTEMISLMDYMILIRLHFCKTCNELINKYSDMFYDNSTEEFNEFCVKECLDKNQTPEDLLSSLNK